MTQETIINIDSLEQELADLQAQLQTSLPLLARLNEIPLQFADLGAKGAAMDEAAKTAQAAADAFTATRQAQEERFETLAEAQAAQHRALANDWEVFSKEQAEQHQLRSEEWQVFRTEDVERHHMLTAEWQAFRTAAETEQNTVMRLAMTTRQELLDRTTAQEALVKSLDERLATMNQALANVAADLHTTRRRQNATAILLSVLVLLSVGLSAAAGWYVFF
jgi:hypothetical protein